MPKIVVEGPDGRKFAFPDTMPRAQINEFMRTKYGTKARDESVQDYLARFGREQAATEARVKDIDREATAVGRAEGERAAERMGVDNPFLMAFAAPAIGLAQQEGGRQVFNREGTVLADEAAGLAAANSAGFFVPGLVNPQFGARVEEGRRQQPLAAFAGDIAGGYGPGEIIGAGVAKAAQAIGPGMAAVGRMFSRGPGPNATNAIAGGTLGGIAPAETAEERARNIAVGVGLGAVARPASQMVDDLTRTGAPRAMPDAMPASASAEAPKTLAQAVRFETPGSPEYEAAKAKGLDMSQAGGRQRGINQGYVMDRVLYHATDKDFKAFDVKKGIDGLGIHLGSVDQAEELIRTGQSMSSKRPEKFVPNAQILPVVTKARNPIRMPDLNDWDKDKVAAQLRKQGIEVPAGAGPDEIVKALQRKGYDSIVYKNTFEGEGGDSFIVFDPASIRSVNAVFDPDNAASPILTAGGGGYFGRQSMRPPGSGPSPREIETQQQWATATPIVTQARTTAQSAQAAADAALQSKAPADIARAKDQKKTLVGQIKEAQASRAGMDTPEDARLAETLASLSENTSDPVLLSTQISAAKTSLDRLLTDIGNPVEGNLIPVRTNILTRTQAPRSAAEGPQDRASVTRYAEGEAPPVKGMGFGAGKPKVNPEAVRSAKSEGFDTSRVLYRGMREPLSPDGLYATTTPGYETQGMGVSLSTSAKAAAEYGENVYPVVVKGKFFSEKEYVNRINKLYETQGMGPRDAAVKVRAELAAKGYAGLKADGGKLLDKGELRVWGDDSGLVPNVKVVNDASGARTVGSSRVASADAPKTAAQAVKYETPGSPEWEAAVAKGLDMSQAGRMGRAKEMGFDTETVLYRAAGTGRESGMNWMSSSPDNAGGYAPDGGAVEPLVLRGKKILTVDADGKAFGVLGASTKVKALDDGAVNLGQLMPKRFNAAVEALSTDDVAAWASRNGYDGVVFKNVKDQGRYGRGEAKIADTYAIFDPSNIRSVNAAFDPEKSGSSTLLAAAPFAAVGGAGLTSERELGSKMTRDKKD